MTTFNRDKSANPQPDRPTEDNNHLLELYNQLIAEVSLRINEGKSEATILQEIQPIFTQIDQADLSDHVKRMVEENNWQVNSYIEGDSELPDGGIGESSQTQLLRGLVWLALSSAITFLSMEPQSKWGKTIRELFENKLSVPVLAVTFIWGAGNLVIGFLRALKPTQPE